jgi:hypothetical protein
MRCLGLVLAVLVLGGCGQEHSSARPGGSPATSTSAAQVEGVRAGADPATVVVDVRLPAGAEGCGRDPRATVLEESAATIWFNVVFTRSHADAYPDPCATWEVVEVPVRLAQPLGSRHVAVNGMGLWARHGSDFRRCDETLGCTPPTDHCDPLWVDRAVLGMDVPVKRLRGVRTVLGCRPGWLVLDLNRAVGNCAPEQGGACASGGTVERVYLRWADAGWQSFAGAQRGGCAEVHAVDPAFPAELCRALGAPA